MSNYGLQVSGIYMLKSPEAVLVNYSDRKTSIKGCILVPLKAKRDSLKSVVMLGDYLFYFYLNFSLLSLHYL